MTDQRLDDVRRKALDRVDKSKKAAIGFLVGAGVLEGAALLAIFFLIDFSDTLHLLIFFCATLVYAPLALGLAALKAYIDLSTQRVLHAVELSVDEN